MNTKAPRFKYTTIVSSSFSSDQFCSASCYYYRWCLTSRVILLALLTSNDCLSRSIVLIYSNDQTSTTMYWRKWYNWTVIGRAVFFNKPGEMIRICSDVFATSNSGKEVKLLYIIGQEILMLIVDKNIQASKNCPRCGRFQIWKRQGKKN